MAGSISSIHQEHQSTSSYCSCSECWRYNNGRSPSSSHHRSSLPAPGTPSALPAGPSQESGPCQCLKTLSLSSRPVLVGASSPASPKHQLLTGAHPVTLHPLSGSPSSALLLSPPSLSARFGTPTRTLSIKSKPLSPIVEQQQQQLSTITTATVPEPTTATIRSHPIIVSSALASGFEISSEMYDHSPTSARYKMERKKYDTMSFPYSAAGHAGAHRTVEAAKQYPQPQPASLHPSEYNSCHPSHHYTQKCWRHRCREQSHPGGMAYKHSWENPHSYSPCCCYAPPPPYSYGREHSYCYEPHTRPMVGPLYGSGCPYHPVCLPPYGSSGKRGCLELPSCGRNYYQGWSIVDGLQPVVERVGQAIAGPIQAIRAMVTQCLPVERPACPVHARRSRGCLDVLSPRHRRYSSRYKAPCSYSLPMPTPLCLRNE